MNEWISVKDGLPPIDKEVLVSNGMVVDVSRRLPCGKWALNYGITFNNATHWMPLPEPPKPERKHEPMDYKLLDKINELDLKIESQLSKLKDVMFSMGDALQAVDEMKHIDQEDKDLLKDCVKDTYGDVIIELQQNIDRDTDTLANLKESLHCPKF